jgi:hypothetical protein
MIIDYKNGFYVENNKSLNCFAAEVIKISEEYIKYLMYRGRISTLGNLSAFDTAIDLMAELFKMENGCLTYFKRHFEKLDSVPSSEEDYIKSLKQFIFGATLNNLTHIYKLTDPVANKLLRNLKAAYKDDNYSVTEIFFNKYIHRKEVDFESAECMDRDTLLNQILSKNGTKHPTAKDFLKYLFDILESQDVHLQAISLNDLLYIYKEIVAIKSKASYNEDKNSASSNVHFKLLFEEVRKGFYVKLNKYLNKKNFSKKENDCLYNIVDEVINCYLNGTKRDSVRELTSRHYAKNVNNSMCYKVEYIIGLLNSEIITLMQRENEINVKQISK